ncbi:MAG: hypothetical protein GWP04_00970 [Gammaproteobacteria bacterium]|nr:hypothetical protein [Gammaproteobacteria bacterium]
MKRMLSLLLVAALGVLAWALPAPEPEESPTTTVPPAVVATTSSHSTCPWAFSDGAVDTFFVAQTDEDADLRFTFPVGGEIRRTVEESQIGPAAAALSLAGVLNQGVSPAVVEFSSSPSAAGIVETGEGVIAADVCPSASSKIWHLPGGSTLEGQTLRLVLFNPFSDDARASVAVTSEAGFEPVPALESVSVPGRSWKVIDLSELLPLRERLSVSVDMKQGVVTPAMVLSEGDDEAVWTNEGQADQWDFPVADAGGLMPRLSISNDGTTPVDYEIDGYSTTGTEIALLSGTLEGRSQVQLDVSGIAEGVFGLRLRASGPVAATLIADDGVRVAATAGVTVSATRWMLPGFGMAGISTLWVMNAGVETTTVTYRLLDAGGALGDVEKVAVLPGRILAVPTVPIGASGLVVEASHPISVAWTMERDGAIAYASGVPMTGQ